MRKQLRKARLAKGYTQQYMAIYLGFKSKSHYCMIENGQRGISVELALRASEILEMPVDELFDPHDVHDVKSSAVPNPEPSATKDSA